MKRLWNLESLSHEVFHFYNFSNTYSVRSCFTFYWGKVISFLLKNMIVVLLFCHPIKNVFVCDSWLVWVPISESRSWNLELKTTFIWKDWWNRLCCGPEAHIYNTKQGLKLNILFNGDLAVCLHFPSLLEIICKSLELERTVFWNL